DNEWIGINSDKRSHPGGEKRANPFGLFDLEGNVREFCADFYSTDYYAQSPPVDPPGPPVGSECVLRGLKWESPHWDPERRNFNLSGGSPTLGLRVFCTAPGLQSVVAKFPVQQKPVGGPSDVSAINPQLDQRAVANWVLSQRGYVRVGPSGHYGDVVRTTEALPAGAINIVAVAMHGNKQISDQDLTRLKGLRSVTHVGLDGTKLTDAGVIHLASLEDLTDLAMCGTRITDTAVDRLRTLPKLRALWIRDTQITNAGIARLATFPSLKILDIRGCKNIAADEVPQRLQSLHLEQFHASYMSDAGLFRLKAIPTLKYLSVSDSSCTDAGLAHLVGLADLIGLDLTNDKQITDAGLVHLTKLPKLKILTLRATSVTDAGAQRFQMAKPNCKLVR
ncbi:MAG TPA: SUMF1/EgtB/PvdO family nonheme iron enzyme, partial [Pirellulales bacterium]